MRNVIDAEPLPSVIAWMRGQAHSGARVELILEGVRAALGPGAGTVAIGVHLIEAFRFNVREIAVVGVWLSAPSDEQRAIEVSP